MAKAVKAVLFVNPYKKNASLIADAIHSELESRAAKVSVFNSNSGSVPDDHWDIAFSLGGDGTVLNAARMLAASKTPIIPIRLGTLAFLAGVENDDWLMVYEQWLNNTARISRRCMLEFSVKRNGLAVFHNFCLNDIVISSLGIAKLIRLKVETELEGKEIAGLGYYRSDGLIVATATGSTAYSLAAGGPILDPEMEAQIINPICSFSLSSRPMVLPSRQILHIGIENEQRSGVLLTVDGQETFELHPNDIITVHQSPHYALLLTTGRSAYYAALKEKLAWGYGCGILDNGISSHGGGNA
ncbi:MAG: NAD(+)/NADH kinase [Treponema sp.]|nr:NAD(+)/NADH kinase [Treponema sp.]